ncbi:MAG: YHYH protein [Planctomycetaceae bacterium]|nr:YHYH protein [Planctomycetaceae bacterium]
MLRCAAAGVFTVAVCLTPAVTPVAEAHDPQGTEIVLTLLSSAVVENSVSITEKDGYRYIVSNGIPDHDTGRFPNRNTPNRISEQQYRFKVTLTPQAARTPTAVGMQPFGVALNGIPFDPAAAEFWRGDRRWQYEALSGVVNLGLDENHAHVQPTGAYHYHGLPTQLVRRLAAPEAMIHIGYAADGFPIYAMLGYADPNDTSSSLVKLRSSYQMRRGQRPNEPNGPGGTFDGTFVQDYEFAAGTGDLDECNGRFGVTPEYPDGTYYYVLTDTFPFIPRLLQGTMDDSFRRGPRDGNRGPGGFGPPGRPPGPPPGAPPGPGRGRRPPFPPPGQR